MTPILRFNYTNDLFIPDIILNAVWTHDEKLELWMLIYLFIIYLLKYIYIGLANYIAVFFLGVQLKIKN